MAKQTAVKVQPQGTPLAKVQSVDGAVPTKAMTLKGVVKTSKGYAVATVVVSAEGNLVSVELANSQAFKEFVVREHQKTLSKLADGV